MKIAIFGGTFNPIHNEHIAFVKAAIKELSLDKLIVIPTCLPPHKNEIPASATDRIAMLNLAFNDIDKVEISDYEILNGGKSYSYITCEHFAKIYKDSERYFLIGGDMLDNFKTWKEPERILNVFNLAVISRDNACFDFEREKEYFKKTFNKDFKILSYKGADCSSTKIRIYNSLGLKISSYCPLSVERYIKEHNLYAGGEYEKFLKEHLTEKRLVHTAGVVLSALSKAKENNLDKEKVKTSALLHDCAKYTDYKTVKGFKLPDKIVEPVIHSFLGAFIAENILKISDKEIIDAIKYHTSGKANMTTLGKLIFIADMIEENRSYDGVDYLRESFKNKSLDDCFCDCLIEEMEHLNKKNTEVYFETQNAYDYYIKRK